MAPRARGPRAGRDGSTASPDRNRLRHHPAEARRQAQQGSRAPADGRGREHFRGLRAVGCRQPAGAMQLQVPAVPFASRVRLRARHGLRGRGQNREGARRQEAHRPEGRERRRPLLRGATRRPALAADQRTAHQGRRLRFGRHRHHRTQAAGRAAQDVRAGTDDDGARPAEGAAPRRPAGPAPGRPCRQIRPREDQGRGREPLKVRIPRQHVA